MKRYLFIFFPVLSFSFCGHKYSHGDFDIVQHNDNHISNKYASDKFDTGLYLVEHHKIGTARKYFLEADSAYPDMPVILNALGCAASRIGDTTESFQYFERALTIDSNYINTYANYGAALNDARNYHEAMDVFYAGLNRENVLAFDRSLLHLNLANSYYYLRQFPRAIILLDSAREGLGQCDLLERINDFENRIMAINLPARGKSAPN